MPKTVCTYDASGNKLTEEIDSHKAGAVFVSTRKTAYAYDAWGNLINTDYDGGEEVSYLQYYYDEKGQVLREYKGLKKPLTITGPDQVVSGGDDDYTTTKYTYDYLGNLIRTEDALGAVETASYDSGGNPIRKTDKAGGVQTLTYNPLGQQLTEVTEAPGKETVKRTWTYDSRGNVIRQEIDGTEAVFTYNGMGQLLSEEEGTIRKEYTLNLAGQELAVRILENGTLLKDTRHTYDLVGRLLTVSEGDSLKVTYQYDKNSRVTASTYGNKLKETVTYNDAGLPLSIINKDSANTVISQYTILIR